VSQFKSTLEYCVIFQPYKKVNDKYVWDEEIVLNNKTSTDYASSWNFYLEDVVSEKIEKLRKEGI
jgi:hypothetical protein